MEAKPIDPWTTIVEIGQQERAFNTLEATYTALASTWLLATFGGVGFMLSANPKLPLPTEVVVLGLGVAGAIGITLVWIVDVLVYHRLLDAAWWTGLAVELDHAEIPQMRVLMFELGAVTPNIKRFYLGMLAAPLVIAVFGAIWSAHLIAPNGEPLAGIFAAYLAIAWLLQVSYITERWSADAREKFKDLRTLAAARFKEWAKAKADAAAALKEA